MHRDKLPCSVGLQSKQIHSKTRTSRIFATGFRFARPFYVLRSSALVAVRRRAFFIVRKEVA